jgi:hypothetical protein
LLLAVPSRDGLEVARSRIRDCLGWEDVRDQLKDQQIDPIREATLNVSLEAAKRRIPEAIQQAYCIVVTVSEKNDLEAFKVTVGADPLFNAVKASPRSRIQETPVNAEALLPGGPYNLWREGEKARRVRDLVGAFAQFPHLPKMLSRRAILDTLVDGCREGLFVLRLTRPDRSVRTWWRETPDETAVKDAGLEVALPEAAALTDLSPTLLGPGLLPGLWRAPEITLEDLRGYFAGGRVVSIPREGYEERLAVPKAERAVVESAVRAAVCEGKLWLTSGPASILGEEIPAGLLTDEAALQAPPAPISTMDLLPERLPEAWSDGTTTAIAISAALSRRVGKVLPWLSVREAIDGAFRARLLERTVDSGPWPCDLAGAAAVKLRPPVEAPPPPPPPPRGAFVAEADLRPNQIQDLAEVVGDLTRAAAGHDLEFHLRIELGGEEPPPDKTVEEMNKILKPISDEMKLRRRPS